MKNIAYSLIMTVLFGSFFPSAQAYANGNKYTEFNRVYNSSFLNEDLINKLAVSKVFESYFNATAAISYNIAVSYEFKSEAQKSEIINKFKNVYQNNEFKSTIDLDKEALAMAVKTNTTADDIVQFDKQMFILKNTLFNQFPELAKASGSDLRNIIDSAISRGGLIGKFTKNVVDAGSDCRQNAVNKYDKCLRPQATWYQSLLITGVVLCFIGALICTALGATAAGAVTAVTGGAASAVAAPIASGCLALFTTCYSGLAIAFSTSHNPSTDCNAYFENLLKTCIMVNGITYGGGI